MTLRDVLNCIDEIQMEKKAMKFVWNETADEGFGLLR